MRYSLLALLVPSLVGAQGAAAPTIEYVCGLVTKAQVEKEIGRKLYDEGEGMVLASGALCNWGGGEAQILLFTGPKSEANWESMIKQFGHGNAKRTPVPGLGGPAYVIYPPPKNEYQETVAMVVVKVAQGTLIVSTSVKKGDPAEKALAPTVSLTKLVLPKLK